MCSTIRGNLVEILALFQKKYVQPQPEAGIFGNQTMRNSGPKDHRDMVTGVQSESLCGHDMMTGATEQTRSRRDMVTGVQREREFLRP